MRKSGSTIASVIFASLMSLAVGALSWNVFAAQSVELTDGWEFRREGGAWESVTVPHDWAISGPFDLKHDRQTVRIVENGEEKASDKVGRTGALPWIGKGEYRRKIAVPNGAEWASLVFNGAMSEPEVFLNGTRIGGWKNGYTPFEVELPLAGGEVVVKLKNPPLSSRWYPGAGLYRPVTLRWGGRVGVKTWGVDVVTPDLETVEVTTELRNPDNVAAEVRHRIFDADGHCVAEGESPLKVKKARPWSPEDPYLYTLETTVSVEGKAADVSTRKFGIRTLEYGRGFFKLNGVARKFKGVCLHHDLGPLGAAFSKDAFRRQVRLLKEMGCDSIRTAHNHPAPGQLEVCDEEGMMVLAESFDSWAEPKVENGYNRFFADWWKRDLRRLVEYGRGHPSVVMWSIGNEVWEQRNEKGAALYAEMQAFVHGCDHDRSRPVSAGASWMPDAIKGGFIAKMDVPAVTYRLPFYEAMHESASRQGSVLGIETASTVSSRGEYFFPVAITDCPHHDNGQCSGYDVECCCWSNLPDDDWAKQDDIPWTIGEFVWTGFDYLGEPTPYDDASPSRSSYFGIFDLAGLPKDRYWLYRSRWQTKDHTLHLVPHWTFPGREGEVTPVSCYTDFDEAELFLNGKSQGRIRKNPNSRLDRYRLRWNDVVYQPGELKVVAYDSDGRPVMTNVVRTAGVSVRTELAKCRFGNLLFVTATLVDAAGTPVPNADRTLSFTCGEGLRFKAICNGDATSLESFAEPSMRTFHGQLVAVFEGAGDEVNCADGLRMPSAEEQNLSAILRDMRADVKALKMKVGYPGKFLEVPGEVKAQRLQKYVTRLVGLRRDGEFYDVGEESVGYVEAESETCPRLFLGESKAEAMNEEVKDFEQTNEMVELRKGCWRTPRPLALRYFRFGGKEPRVVRFAEEIADVTNCVPFSGSEREVLMRNVALRTLRLCMRDFLIDGVKRDRLPWSGDLSVSLIANAYSFRDPEIVKRTLTVLDSVGWEAGDVNGIIDFSLWHVISHEKFQEYFGDLDFLKASYPRIAGRLDSFARRVGMDGLIDRASLERHPTWLFIDWTDDAKSTTAVNMLHYGALLSGAKLADRVGAKEDAVRWTARAAAIKAKLHERAWDAERGLFRFDVTDPDCGRFTRHANLYAAYFGVAEGKELESIGAALAADDLPAVGTPYVNAYQVMALLKCGRTDAARRCLERVWGAMLDAGATSFWEGYDEKERGDERWRFYGRPFAKSLCHAWSAAPVFLLPMLQKAESAVQMESDEGDNLQSLCQRLVDEAVANGEQGGVQFCVYKDGKCIVDVWAGKLATNANAAAVRGDSLFPIFSTEKPILATAVHRAVEKGKMSYDKPLCTWWPEFTGDGKEKLTLRETLGYRSGMPGGCPGKLTTRELADWRLVVRTAAADKPELVPGTKQRYMPYAYAWMLGHPLEVALGKPLKDVLDEEVLVPAGIADDFYFVADESLYPRIATFYRSEFCEVMNNPWARKAILPSAWAVASARGIAKFYNRLCGFDGKDPLIRRETLEAALKPCRHSSDPLPDAETMKRDWFMIFGMGYGLWGESDRMDRVFGHGGAGGSEGLVDCDNRLVVAYTCNFDNYKGGLRQRLYDAVGMKWRYWKDRKADIQTLQMGTRDRH